MLGLTPRFWFFDFAPVGWRFNVHQTMAGRHLQVFYVPDEDPEGVFVITPLARFWNTSGRASSRQRLSHIQIAVRMAHSEDKRWQPRSRSRFPLWPPAIR